MFIRVSIFSKKKQTRILSFCVCVFKIPVWKSFGNWIFMCVFVCVCVCVCVQRCQPHSLTKLTIFKIWQEDFEVGRKILTKCISWDCWLKNHDPSPRVSFFLTAQLRHYSPFWKLFNLLTAPVYCGCCALIGSLLTWPWLALKIDITASLDSGPPSFSLCTVLNEKGDRGTIWKRIKRAEDFEFSSTGDFAIERKNGRNYVERKIFRPKRKGWQLCVCVCEREREREREYMCICNFLCERVYVYTIVYVCV